MQNKKILKLIQFIYIILYLCYLILNSILPYTSMQPSIIKNAISIFFAVVGVFFIGYNILFNRKKIKTNYAWLLWLFIVVCILSSITMIKYGYIDNLKTIVWSSILFGVLYTYSAINNSEQVKKLVKTAIICISIIWSVSILISLFQYIMQIGYTVKVENSAILKAQGFYYNRLFGIFVDPNFASVTSTIILFSSIYTFITSNRRWKKLIWVLNCMIQFTYIILSGSRTGLVVFALGSIIYSWLKIRSYFYKKNDKNIFKVIGCTIISIIIITGIFIGAKFILENIPNIIKQNINSSQTTNNTQQSNTQTNVQNTQKNETKLNTEKPKVNLNRTDLNNKGISNLRFELWSDCLDILKSKPILGTSPRNLISYAKDCFKDTYPAKGYDFGNGYLAVFVGTGVVGAIVIAIFLISCVRKLYIYIIHYRYHSSDLDILSIVIICIMALAAAINQEIFLINSINTALFWLMLGYILERSNSKPIIENGKKKVGIVTIHDADNYGSALQAYATQKVVDNIGYNAIIVDHICKKISKEYGIKRIFAQKNMKSIIETIIRIIVIYPSRIRFKKFREEFFKTQNEELVINTQEEFHKFIVGSDQVWNYKITGFDKGYFLDFVTDNNKKVSFASSFGITQIDSDKKSEYGNLLNKFNHIAVREEQAVDIIKTLTEREVPTVLDPTLLLSKTEWQEITKKPKKYNNYILCYQIAYSQSLVDFAQELARKTNKKIISIQGSMRHKFDAKYIWNAGPIEFVSLFLNADYIITNSFHGTAFSINFNKNFFTELLPSFEKTSSRLENILKVFELTDRQIIEGKNANMLNDINYEKTNVILEEKRKQSMDILKMFMEGE